MPPAKKAAPKQQQEAPEEPRYEVQGADRWQVEEHVRSSHVLYDQPGWLVQSLLRGHDDPEGYTQAYVQGLIDAYNKRPVYSKEQQ